MTIKIKNTKNKTLKRKLTNSSRSTIVKTFLEMLNTTKLYHWSTYSYSQHIATDELYHSLNKHIDMFVEIMLGKTKDRLKNIVFSTRSANSKKTFIKEIVLFKEYLISLNSVMDPVTDSDLYNVRDEILGTLDKLLYLFELN